MDNIKPKATMRSFPSAEYRYFLYEPEGDGMVYFSTESDRDEYAGSALQGYLDEEWSEEIEFIAAGELTHFPQVLDKKMRPTDDELDECLLDGDGIVIGSDRVV